jgi:hypothetical protein
LFDQDGVETTTENERKGRKGEVEGKEEERGRETGFSFSPFFFLLFLF